ncbi:hypothetical protein RND81_13G009100 [Saponaria officinalis]|uniref:Uncharacterized protein n=1 Tax=Saponaria officinalis TaxID=3572 RepID=A0AAW1GUU1_SAPOF
MSPMFYLLSFLVYWFYDCRVRSPKCRNLYSSGGRLLWFVFHLSFLRSCSISTLCSCHSTTHVYQWYLGDESRVDVVEENARARSSVLHQLGFKTLRFYVCVAVLVLILCSVVILNNGCNTGSVSPYFI